MRQAGQPARRGVVDVLAYRPAMAVMAKIGTAGPMMLVERTDQLDELEIYRAEAARGSGRVVLIRGEAGIGKSALARAFVSRLPDGSRVIFTSCEDLSTPRPLAPLHDAVPALGDRLGGMLDGAAPRLEIASWVLGQISSGGFRTWVFEDIHWADDATLDLLRYLARRIDDAPVLLIATYREEGQPRAALSSVLGDLATLASVRQVRLPQLSRAGVAAVAAGTHADADDLHRLTAGNPFYVTEVLAAGGDTIPVSVRDAIRARIARLDARARRALEATAILGASVEPWLLAAVSGEDLPGIDDCLAAGVVRSEPARIVFQHELTRMTVLEDLPVFRGIGLHRRALDALRRAGHGDEARLAYHAEGAADADAVLRHGLEAGMRALAMCAHREAAEQFQRCVRFAGGLDESQRLRLHEQTASALFMTGRLDEADAARGEALAASRRLADVRREGDNLRQLARLRLFSRGAAEALPLAERARELLEPLGETRELALSYCALGHIAAVDQRPDDAKQWSGRGLELGRRLDDAEVVAYALNDLGTSELLGGRSSGTEKLERSLGAARRGGFNEHIDRAMINLAETSLHNREPRRAEGYLRDLEDFNAASQIELCSLGGLWAEAYLYRGRWDDARQKAELCMHHQKSSTGEKALAAIVLGALAVRSGHASAAGVSAADASVSSCAHPSPQIRWHLAALHAEAAWIAGDMHEVHHGLQRSYDEAVAHGDPWAMGDLGRWLWRAGRLRALDARAAAPYALQVAGDWRAAVLEWERREAPYEVALCLLDSLDPADLEEAHDRLLALGADAAARRVATKMREVGARVPRGPRPSTRSNPAGLTARECEVAELAASGLTNREIADRLVLSDRTVAHHVSAILGKLGARRRADIRVGLAGEGAVSHPPRVAI